MRSRSRPRRSPFSDGSTSTRSWSAGTRPAARQAKGGLDGPLVRAMRAAGISAADGYLVVFFVVVVFLSSFFMPFSWWLIAGPPLRGGGRVSRRSLVPPGLGRDEGQRAAAKLPGDQAHRAVRRREDGD